VSFTVADTSDTFQPSGQRHKGSAIRAEVVDWRASEAADVCDDEPRYDATLPKSLPLPFAPHLTARALAISARGRVRKLRRASVDPVYGPANRMREYLLRFSAPWWTILADLPSLGYNERQCAALAGVAESDLVDTFVALHGSPLPVWERWITWYPKWVENVAARWRAKHPPVNPEVARASLNALSAIAERNKDDQKAAMYLLDALREAPGNALQMDLAALARHVFGPTAGKVSNPLLRQRVSRVLGALTSAKIIRVIPVGLADPPIIRLDDAARSGVAGLFPSFREMNARAVSRLTEGRGVGIQIPLCLTPEKDFAERSAPLG
jgi:hypothetical protein